MVSTIWPGNIRMFWLAWKMVQLTHWRGYDVVPTRLTLWWEISSELLWNISFILSWPASYCTLVGSLNSFLTWKKYFPCIINQWFQHSKWKSVSSCIVWISRHALCQRIHSRHHPHQIFGGFNCLQWNSLLWQLQLRLRRFRDLPLYLNNSVQS